MNDEPRTRDPLSWPLIVGLSSLALLWPLTGLWPVLGEGPLRAFVLIGITGAVWIGTVGFARVARPVLHPDHLRCGIRVHQPRPRRAACGHRGRSAPAPAMLMAFIPSLAMGAGVGALAGLAAAGIQALLGRREER
jgi:hypothetical protein